jgi:hypothetical protein
MQQTTDTTIIDNLKSRLLFGNTNDADPIVAIASLRESPDTCLFISKSEMSNFDPKIMQLEISEISSGDQLDLVLQECIHSSRSRLHFLSSLILEYLQEEEEVLND